MSTVHYRNAALLIEGASLAGEFNELSIAYGAEMLDETSFGDDTRVNKGGLKTAEVSGGGNAEFSDYAAADLAFELVGTDGIGLALFPDGVTEGAACGYAMRGVISDFSLGGAVGSLLPFTLTAQGRGVEA